MPLLDSSPVTRTRDLKVGDTLGKLLLTDAMGEGATGKVFRALHQTLKIPVAVKFLQSAELSRDPSLRAQLRAEAQLLAQVNHPNIIRVWDFEDDPELPYLVLEIAEGLSLAELIGQSGRLSSGHALEIVLQIADGLAVAHRLGIIHRDVKPGNILLTKARVPKLVDLGLAIVAAPDNRNTMATESGRYLDVVGTPAYMAPEQFLAPDRVDHRCDIYSLGVSFYHAVTGRLPFEGASPRQVMLSKVQHSFTPPHEIVVEVTPSVSEVILRMMEKDPDDRFNSYDELLNELRSLKNDIHSSSSDMGLSSAQLSNLRSSRTHPSIQLPTNRPSEPPSLPNVHLPKAEVDTALASRTQKVAQAPVLPARLLEAAQAAAKSGDRGRARELLRHALRVEPTSETAWVWMAAMGDTPGEKIDALLRVLELNPQHAKARAGLLTITLQAGVTEAKAGNREKARRYLARATELDPNHELAWLWRAKVADSQEESQAYLRRVLDINPENERARTALTKTSPATGGWTCPICQVPAVKAPKSCTACGASLVLADLPTWQARPQLPTEVLRRAEARHQEALQRTPTPARHFALALVYLNGKEFARAADQLRAAARLRPADAPLARQVESFANQVDALQPGSNSSGWQGTILVVDDSPTIRKVVARALADYDYRIVEAADGAAGLEAVRKESPDLVLLDVTMPGLDGYQVCRSLRANPATVNLPVVMLSGKDGLFDKLRGRMVGATEYLTKPFVPDVLVQVVEKHCSRHRARQAARKA